MPVYSGGNTFCDAVFAALAEAKKQFGIFAKSKPIYLEHSDSNCENKWHDANSHHIANESAAAYK